jgi:hypothetical protein
LDMGRRPELKSEVFFMRTHTLGSLHYFRADLERYP